jgi:hypothetical protein
MRRSYTSWRQDAAWLNQAEAWPASLFPAADYHYFRDCGCLVCALAVMLRHYDVETESDETLFNPWILNQRLIDCGAFDAAADLELAYIDHLYPLAYLGVVPYSQDVLRDAAHKGQLCLVAVPGIRSGKHFLALCGLAGDDAVVYDPLCGQRRLSTYEHVYNIRVFRREGQGETRGD